MLQGASYYSSFLGTLKREMSRLIGTALKFWQSSANFSNEAYWREVPAAAAGRRWKEDTFTFAFIKAKLAEDGAFIAALKAHGN